MSEGIAPRFDDKQSAFKEFYSVNYAVLSAAEETIRNLLQLLLADIAIETPKLGSRVKSRDECIEKFVLKYRDQLERDAIDYKIQDYITDLIGVRIICLYETDIPLVERAIRDAFEVLSTTNKTKSLIEQVDAFGYKGLHLDVKLNGPRKEF